MGPAAYRVGETWPPKKFSHHSRQSESDRRGLVGKLFRGRGATLAPILMRGKLHVEVFDSEFPGEEEAGARLLVARVRSAVNVRFKGNVAQPDILWTDRGKGFYRPNDACITGGFKSALREHHLKAIHGDDASAQPGKLQEVMLHETAVSWIRLRLARSVPAKAWEETREQYTARLKSICREINETLDVEGLCRALPARIAKLVERKGDRLDN